jgi:hypothetical protein
MTFDEQGDNLSTEFQTTQASLAESLHDLQDEFVKFDDFSEPNLVKTGYLIPLQCGHNGVMSLNERTIYEIHLTNSGMIQQDAIPEDIYEDEQSPSDVEHEQA